MGESAASALTAADLRASVISKAMSKADSQARGDSQAKEAGATKARAPDRSICKILVVDDSPTERFFLSDLLTKRGYTVVTAENGDEAIAKARDEQPTLVVMDVVMPGMSGYQATRAINRDPATQNIPVILCTSKSAESDKVWGLRQGARDYVVKPVDIPDLLTKIAKLA